MNHCGFFLLKFIRLGYLPALLPAVLLILLASGVCAQTREEEILSKMRVDEKLNAAVPLDLAFTDQNGSRVKLRDYFTGEPVILTLNFYECPMLCPLVFKSLVEAMEGIQGLSLNKDFRIVTVSFNAEETPARTKEKAMETYSMTRGITNLENRWPFLMGNQPEIDRLTDAVGFRYVKVAKDNFAHPAAIMILTPEGRVARYLYGIEQNPRDLKLALIEAADGKIGGSQLLNRALLYCFHYDPEGKKYAVAAVNIMKFTGGIVFLLLGVLIFSLWRREKDPGGRGGN